LSTERSLFKFYHQFSHIFLQSSVISWHIQIWKNIELRFSKEIIFIYISFVHFRYVLTNSYQPYITLSGGLVFFGINVKKSIITSQYNKKTKLLPIFHTKKSRCKHTIYHFEDIEFMYKHAIYHFQDTIANASLFYVIRYVPWYIAMNLKIPKG
jgi:hypothetical protein